MLEILTPMSNRTQFHKEMIRSVPPNIKHTTIPMLDNVGKSRRALLNIATEDHIAMLDDDDMLDSGLEEVAIGVNSWQVHSVMPTTRRYFNPSFITPFNDMSGVSYKNFLARRIIPHNLIVVRRDVALRCATLAEQWIQMQGANNYDKAANAFDLAYYWFVVTEGLTYFFAKPCYLWRIHSSNDQMHSNSNPYYEKANRYGMERFAAKFGSEGTSGLI